MATVTSVVQITVLDEQNYTRTFNIDNPVENLTLNQINQALTPAFLGRWWISSRGNVITRLESATYATSSKTAIGGEVISITPSEINTTNETATVTVDGGTIQGARLDNVVVTTNPQINTNLYISSIENNKINLKIDLSQVKSQTIFNATATLVIIVNNVELKVPVLMNPTITPVTPP